jgi:hypothetical protein
LTRTAGDDDLKKRENWRGAMWLTNLIFAASVAGSKLIGGQRYSDGSRFESGMLLP